MLANPAVFNSPPPTSACCVSQFIPGDLREKTETYWDAFFSWRRVRSSDRHRQRRRKEGSFYVQPPGASFLSLPPGYFWGFIRFLLFPARARKSNTELRLQRLVLGPPQLALRGARPDTEKAPNTKYRVVTNIRNLCDVFLLRRHINLTLQSIYIMGLPNLKQSWYTNMRVPYSTLTVKLMNIYIYIYGS